MSLEDMQKEITDIKIAQATTMTIVNGLVKSTENLAKSMHNQKNTLTTNILEQAEKAQKTSLVLKQINFKLWMIGVAASGVVAIGAFIVYSIIGNLIDKAML